MPTDLCAPIQTPAEEALYWSLYQDLACKNRNGSDNFLLMAAQFNQQWSRQVRACSHLCCHGTIDSNPGTRQHYRPTYRPE